MNWNVLNKGAREQAVSACLRELADCVGDGSDLVDEILMHNQDFFDELESNDFFGTEGIAHFAAID